MGHRRQYAFGAFLSGEHGKSQGYALAFSIKDDVFIIRNEARRSTAGKGRTA